jgi:hypothetical protein
MRTVIVQQMNKEIRHKIVLVYKVDGVAVLIFSF